MKQCAVIWFERNVIFARSLAGKVREHALPDLDLVFLYAQTASEAADRAASAERLVLDVASGGDAFALLDAWVRQGKAPAVVLGSEGGLCDHLSRRAALPLRKSDVSSAMRELARAIVNPWPTEAPLSREQQPACLHERYLEETTRLGLKYAAARERLELIAIRRALRCEHSVLRAAERLGWKRSTLESKMHKLGLSPGLSKSIAHGRSVDHG